MTIDIKKMFNNLLKKQFSIEHIDLKSEVFSVNALPKRIKQKIFDKWSDKYLLDADYILFIKGNIGSKMLNRLFNSINLTFGQDANLLTKGDIKTLDVNGRSQDEEVEELEPEDQDESLDEDDDIQAPVDMNVPMRYVFVKLTLKR